MLSNDRQASQIELSNDDVSRAFQFLVGYQENSETPLFAYSNRDDETTRACFNFKPNGNKGTYCDPDLWLAEGLREVNAFGEVSVYRLKPNPDVLLLVTSNGLLNLAYLQLRPRANCLQ